MILESIVGLGTSGEGLKKELQSEAFRRGFDSFNEGSWQGPIKYRQPGQELDADREILGDRYFNPGTPRGERR